MKQNRRADPNRLQTVWEAVTRFAVKPVERVEKGGFRMASAGKPDAVPEVSARILVLRLDLSGCHCA